MTNTESINEKFMESMKSFMDEVEYEMRGIKFHHLVDSLLKYGYLLFTKEEVMLRVAYILACHWGSNDNPYEEDFTDKVLDFPTIEDVVEKYKIILEGERIVPYQYNDRIDDCVINERPKTSQYFKHIISDTKCPETEFHVSRDIYTLMAAEARSQSRLSKEIKGILMFNIRSLKHVNYRIGKVVEVFAATTRYAGWRLTQEEFSDIFKYRNWRPLGKKISR